MIVSMFPNPNGGVTLDFAQGKDVLKADVSREDLIQLAITMLASAEMSDDEFDDMVSALISLEDRLSVLATEAVKNEPKNP